VVSVHAFWDRYVSDVPLDTINPPAGRLAVVIDGNSPDPDDIGATPVMLALLQQAKLSERLVHLGQKNIKIQAIDSYGKCSHTLSKMASSHFKLTNSIVQTLV